MYRPILILATLCLFLAACASAPVAADPTAPAAVSAPTPTTASQPAPAATDAPAEAPAAGSQTTFVIVPGESSVSYAVGEVFLNQGNAFNNAVGVTTEVNGSLTIDYTNPQNSTISPITVDISQFKSDSSRRDSVIRNDWLESSSFPIATFTPTLVESLPAAGQEGTDYTFQVTGDLTVKETTRTVTFTVTARLEGDTLTGTASTTILMSDFGVGPINIANILTTEDEVKLTFNFIARP